MTNHVQGVFARSAAFVSIIGLIVLYNNINITIKQQEYAKNASKKWEPSYYTCNVKNQTHTLPEAPAIVLIGAQKGGTSALLSTLTKHPQILPSILFEPHFLDWNTQEIARKNRMANLTPEEGLCQLRKSYADRFNFSGVDLNNKTVYTFEKTPSYLAEGRRISKQLREICFWKVKVVAVLRDPVERLWSQFMMNVPVDRNKSSPTKGLKVPNINEFHSMLLTELKRLTKNKLTAINVHSFYNESIMDEPFQSLVPSMKNLSEEEDEKLEKRYKLAWNKKTSLLMRGMYALQLHWWLQDFSKQDLMVLKYDDLYSEKGSQAFDSLLDFVGIKKGAVSLPDSFRQRQSRSRNVAIPDLTQRFLESFYRPYNKLMMDVLGDEWKDWPEGVGNESHMPPKLG